MYLAFALVNLQIEVALSGVEAKEETEPDIKPTALKVIPPWMIKQGMNLTIEQRRGIMPEPNVEHNSDDKKSSVDDKKPSADRDNEKSLQVSLRLDKLKIMWI